MAGFISGVRNLVVPFPEVTLNATYPTKLFLLGLKDKEDLNGKTIESKTMEISFHSE